MTRPTQAQVEAARERARREAGTEPRAASAFFDAERELVMVVLTNGCVFGFPPGEVQGLEDAPAHLLAEVEVASAGEGLHWEALDADLSVPGIIARLTGVQALAAKFLGRATSPAKARAARENGKKGGRPRKESAETRATTAKPPVRDTA